MDCVRALAPGLIASTGVPGMAVTVTDATGRFESDYFGVRDLRTLRKVDPATMFQIGSVSKAIASLGAVRAHVLGLIDLDEPIVPRLRSWKFPEHLARGRDLSRITLRTLISHTAGLNVHGYPYLPPDRPAPSAAQILDGIDGPEHRLDFLHDPGTKCWYASAHFVLLQCLIEDVTGQPYARWMHENVLMPLGMWDSSYVWNADIRARLASRHTGERDILPMMHRAVLASSNLHTNSRDLARATSLMFRARFGDHTYDWYLPPELAAEMIRPQPPWLTQPHWGLGWYLGEGFQQTTFKAGGAFEGVWCWLEGFPQTGVTVVMLTNSQSGAYATKPIMERLRPSLLGHAPASDMLQGVAAATS